MKKSTSWGSVAGWYDELLSDTNSYQSQVVLPNLLRLLKPSKGEVILDVACGNGFFSKALTEAGVQVVGVDISPELIALAKEHVPEGRFFVSPAHMLKDVATESVDKAICILAIQNIQEVKETFQEIQRVLKPGSKGIIVMNHPAFRIPKESSWGFEGTKMYRRIDAYLSEKTLPIVMHPGQESSEETVSFHRPLQFYAKHLASASLAITRIEEWISHRTSQAGPRQKEEDRTRKEIPLFMMLEIVKMV